MSPCKLLVFLRSAAITKCQGRLAERTDVYFSVVESGKPKVRAPAWSGLVRAPFLSLCLTVPGVGECRLVRAPSPPGGPTLMTSSKPTQFPSARLHVLPRHGLGLRGSNFEGTQFILSIHLIFTTSCGYKVLLFRKERPGR